MIMRDQGWKKPRVFPKNPAHPGFLENPMGFCKSPGFMGFIKFLMGI